MDVVPIVAILSRVGCYSGSAEERLIIIMKPTFFFLLLRRLALPRTLTMVVDGPPVPGVLVYGLPILSWQPGVDESWTFDP